jgi:biotin carboxylase
MKLAVIGASYLQVPLIQRAREMGHETWAFAWAAGDPGERAADHFVPISIVEKDAILARCREIGADGVCTIASDLAAVTAGYVAHGMGLPCNPPEAVLAASNKRVMRRAFEAGGDPSPRSLPVSGPEDTEGIDFSWPVIVKPLDRSGSRGITRVERAEELPAAIEAALSQGFEKTALVEEFAPGREYSVEGLSWEGRHTILTVTEKYTTGAPGFIETGHMEPAGLSPEAEEKIRSVVVHALDSLGVRLGASHAEVKIDGEGRVRIIEIGARMGGDLIGSHLVPLTTGFDYLGDVIRCALGREPEAPRGIRSRTPVSPAAAVRFVFSPEDLRALETLKRTHPEYLLAEETRPLSGERVTDSSSRFGYFLMAGPSRDALAPLMPPQGGE